jgi:hypothetical protein
MVPSSYILSSTHVVFYPDILYIDTNYKTWETSYINGQIYKHREVLTKERTDRQNRTGQLHEMVFMLIPSYLFC